MRRLTVDDYFAAYADHPGITVDHITAATELVRRVNALLEDLVLMYRVDLDINPNTKTLVAGTKNGGWRPQDCPIGAPGSSHKQGEGVDLYDGDADIDGAITDQLLIKHGLYREHPSATRSWCHLTTRAPKSGRRSFYP